MEFSESIIVVTLSLVAMSIYLFWLSREACKKRLLPEAPGGWPVIGHLPLLTGSEPPHITLGKIADKIGPVFTIKLGVHRALVVNNWELAGECLCTNDKAFANRPKAIAFEILGYNNLMFAFSPYGDYWRQIRKIINHEVLSNRRLQMLKHVRETEVKEAIKGLHQQWIKNQNSSNKAFVEMKRWFRDITLNLILKIIVGKRYAEYSQNDGDDGLESERKWQHALRNFFIFTGKFVVSDALPFLKWLDLGGDQKKMKQTAKEMDNVIRGWLQEHKQKKASGASKGQEDFMDVLLSILDNTEDLSTLDTDAINKATCLILILGASDSTSVTLTWTLSLLLNNPDILVKAQRELDFHVGRERRLMESDTKNLVYLQAIIKESLRLYPAAPLLGPRESMEHCNIMGHDIPAGTRLIVNAYKIHRDSRVWLNPSEFRPERFLTTHKDADVKGQDLKLIPFGSGRRVCPGISFALQVLNLTLATLLHSFDIETSSGQPIDMTESAGLTNLKATPVDVLLTPRLPAHVYYN